MGKIIDLIGKRFNRLLVIEKCDFQKRGNVIWKCQCDCGNITYVITSKLTSEWTRSCGCLKVDSIIARSTTHGMRSNRLYGVWYTMKERCYNKNSEKYSSYGGRGITVSDNWRNSFESFINDMGMPIFDKLQIERIDNDKGYCVENCRWATIDEQAKNKRSTVWMELNGERICLKDWTEKLGLNYKTVYNQLKYLHWSIEKIKSQIPPQSMSVTGV